LLIHIEDAAAMKDNSVDQAAAPRPLDASPLIKAAMEVWDIKYLRVDEIGHLARPIGSSTEISIILNGSLSLGLVLPGRKHQYDA
jgi:antitoxin component HigA of HigAB toxin-antitoxin module